MGDRRWNRGRMLLALASYFDWHANELYTEFPVDGGLADLVQITRAGYLTEIEIKISRSDWLADQHKQKFKTGRPHVSRFFYAVPDPLHENIPDFVPESVGIIRVSANKYGDTFCRTVRQAKRSRCLKAPEPELKRMRANLYYRFWNSELARIRQHINHHSARSQARAVAAPLDAAAGRDALSLPAFSSTACSSGECCPPSTAAFSNSAANSPAWD